MYSLLVALSLLFVIPQITQADEEAVYYVESDPGSFIFSGYSINIFISPQYKSKYRIGSALFSLDFPDFIIDTNSRNTNKGWRLRTKIGVDLYVDRMLWRKQDLEWYGGLIGVFFTNQLSQIDLSRKTSQFQQLSIGLRSGIAWYPFNNRFYVSPWLAITRNIRVSGNNRIANDQFDIQKLSPFGSVHLGLRF